MCLTSLKVRAISVKRLMVNLSDNEVHLEGDEQRHWGRGHQGGPGLHSCVQTAGNDDVILWKLALFPLTVWVSMADIKMYDLLRLNDIAVHPDDVSIQGAGFSLLYQVDVITRFQGVTGTCLELFWVKRLNLRGVRFSRQHMQRPMKILTQFFLYLLHKTIHLPNLLDPLTIVFNIIRCSSKRYNSLFTYWK